MLAIMSAKPDVLAIQLIGEEVVRLLSLLNEDLGALAREGLNLIAEMA